MAGCHDLEAGKAARLIQAAHDAKCNAVKTQWCSNVKRLADRRKIEAPDYSRLAFPASWHPTFADDCKQKGMEYICTIFLPEDIDLVPQFVDHLKIASLEAADLELVRACLDTVKPVIVSTGCMDEKELRLLRESLSEPIHRKWSRTGLAEIDWLHSVSSYPVPIGESNLSVLNQMDDSGLGLDGYSDQTGRVITGALAVAAGGRIIEVHMRLDDTVPTNPDFGHSLTPTQLKEYVDLVRLAEAEMGDGIKTVQPSEAGLRDHRIVSL